jgi:hypothetical protein
MVPEGVIYLEDEGVTLDGLKLWGSPVTPIFEDWVFMHGTATIGTYWDAIPDDTDVLITHGPARGVLDQVLPEGERVGCPGCVRHWTPACTRSCTSSGTFTRDMVRWSKAR